MAELLRKIVDGQSLYAIWQITETAEELRSAIILDAGEELLFSSFVAESRKKQWLAYRILLRSILSPDDISIEYDPSGKPFLAGSDLHISVTHSEDMAAVIISRQARVGIDVEKIKPRILNVRDKFIGDEESSFINKETELEQLTLAWCAKEALYKLFGKRNLDFRDNIRVDIPSIAGISFHASIRQDGACYDYRLHSEKLGDFILVYTVEEGLSS